ncbi:MAG: division/cell wall cluster transcriptional repressor MraZ [Bacillota bacterium]|uniref:Transcriptional regulator MraZ n=1 Tax=Thermanaerosceptrum fracticalcis TaxID=1712410 RepID=A0A7G6DZJ1_THEFR|nr:division/cell wall cluster transcriptional repressor MraZ [Thermanaerosceptrum fracticalcis]QNB45245.1 division/cell wall cluster transcriptional repressor MraZ [Thermanaerosceptrum fracticalcis]
MFTGEYQHSIDEKGRLIMPAKLREALGDRFMTTKGLDGCLFVYPLTEWKLLEEKLKNLPFTNKDARAFARFFFAGATECEVDKQGRVLISANLREYAGLNKDVVIIGVGTRLEIWSKEAWEGYSSETEKSYEELAEKMVDLDLGF